MAESQQAPSKAPTKAEREKCWKHRDNYWKCLDDHGNEQEKCASLRKLYEESCTKQWVKHFDRRRDFLKYKDKLEKEGFELKPE